MSLQILKIVIYSHDGRQRILPINSGAVTVITGGSKTGKSALIDIVDYCFGNDECHVPVGPIRRAVSWFGLHLQLTSGQAFVARRCPRLRAASSEDCFIDAGDVVSVPPHSALRQTTNTKGLTAMLSGWCGIGDNLHEPQAGQTRLPLIANVRHGLALCFQPQDEIIRRKQLFHGASDNFFAQALKDTLPYFLGAVDDEYVRKREQIRRLKDQLRAAERKLSEITALRGEGVTKADGLLAQAREAGLSDAPAESWETTIAALKEIAATPLADVQNTIPVGSEYARLADERSVLLSEHRSIRSEIESVRAFERDEQGFSREATEQHSRLKTVDIFDSAEPGHNCPLCSQPLAETAQHQPAVADLRGTLAALSSRLNAVGKAAPNLERAVADLDSKLRNVQDRLARNREQMNAIRSADQKLAQIQDDTTKTVHILGRISLYVESLPDLPDTQELEQQATSLREQITAVELELSDERVRERLESITSILGQNMTAWARELRLEHSISPLRLDLKNLTIVADTEDGPIPMGRMGSGENWVGYHLIAHLALHQWFVKRIRPVPRFLFLDQPSQVYFPPEKDVHEGSLDVVPEDDRAAVSRMFDLIFRAVADVAPGLQVIITEHADLSAEWYQSAVNERWRGGLKLVPDDWPAA